MKVIVTWEGLADRHDAWDSLVTRFQEILFYASYTLLENKEAAEDNVQDTFIRAFTYFFGYPERVNRVAESMGAYLCQIARNEAINKLNKKSYQEISLEQKSEESYLQLWEDERGFEQTELADELQQLFAGVVDGLNGNAKRCINLWVQGFNAREISAMLGVKESTVATNIYRAREKLRKVGI